MKQIVHTQEEVIQSLATQLIALALKYHGIPWRNPVRCDPENCGLPLDVATGEPFDPVSTLLVQTAAQSKDFAGRWWGTSDIWKELCGLVRHNEQSTWIAVPEKAEAYVYNIEQVDGEEIKQFRPFDCEVISAEEMDLGPIQQLANKHRCETADFTSQGIFSVLRVLAKRADLGVGKEAEVTFREMATDICVGWLATELRCPLPACHVVGENAVLVWMDEMHRDTSWIFRVCERARKMLKIILRV